MKVYFARPISNYKTPQDESDLSFLAMLGFDVVNPDKQALSARYKSEGMRVFEQAAADCDAIVFRAFDDGAISAGVYKEIMAMAGKPVLEFPTIAARRVLSVEETRERLERLGRPRSHA